MAKRTVKSPDPEEMTGMEPEDWPTDEQWEEWERERKAAHEAEMAPYRAVHEQQNDQDDLLAEALFEIDLLKLGIEE